MESESFAWREPNLPRQRYRVVRGKPYNWRSLCLSSFGDFVRICAGVTHLRLFTATDIGWRTVSYAFVLKRRHSRLAAQSFSFTNFASVM